MKKPPHLLQECFCHNAKSIASETLNEIFKPCFSEEGTRQREREELVVMHWRDYIQECEGLYTYTYYSMLF